MRNYITQALGFLALCFIMTAIWGTVFGLVFYFADIK